MNRFFSKQSFVWAWIGISFLGGSIAHADASPRKGFPPAPSSYVYDETSLLTGEARGAISQVLAREDQQTGNQVLVAIFKSLDEEDLVDYTNRLFQNWKIGEKQKNNGVLLAIFLNEHKIRIEVGYGLEPILTDAKSNRIISMILTPAFKQGAYDAGVEGAVKAILNGIQAGVTSDEPLPENRASSGRERAVQLRWIIILLIIIFQIVPRIFGGGNTIRRGGFGGGYWGGGFGGGGFGGGGFGGGGGFSGGGGSSGGGGASGGW